MVVNSYRFPRIYNNQRLVVIWIVWAGLVKSIKVRLRGTVNDNAFVTSCGINIRSADNIQVGIGGKKKIHLEVYFYFRNIILLIVVTTRKESRDENYYQDIQIKTFHINIFYKITKKYNSYKRVVYLHGKRNKHMHPMNIKGKKYFLYFLILTLPAGFISCKSSEGFKNQEQYERQKAKDSRKAERELKKMRKAHMDNQSEQTKAMMKATRKKAKEINRFRRK